MNNECQLITVWQFFRCAESVIAVKLQFKYNFPKYCRSCLFDIHRTYKKCSLREGFNKKKKKYGYTYGALKYSSSVSSWFNFQYYVEKSFMSPTFLGKMPVMISDLTYFLRNASLSLCQGEVNYWLLSYVCGLWA